MRGTHVGPAVGFHHAGTSSRVALPPVPVGLRADPRCRTAQRYLGSQSTIGRYLWRTVCSSGGVNGTKTSFARRVYQWMRD